MGLSFSEHDAALAALGQVPANAAELARTYAGAVGSLTDVDALLSSLSAGVSQAAVPAARPAPKVAPQKPAPQKSAPQKPAPAPAKAAPAPQAPEPAPAPTLAATPQPASALDRAPLAPTPGPNSELISLPEPVVTDRPREQERSGAFALDVEDESDADFEAEFAALAAPLARPTETAQQAPVPASPAKVAEPAPIASAPVPVAPATDDDLGDAPLSLFDDVLGGDPTAPPAPKPRENKPSSRPVRASENKKPSTQPNLARDPDAEFDALFADAASPSSMPLSELESDPNEDSVDDLLRDLGTPRVPQDLKDQRAEFASALAEDLEGEDPGIDVGLDEDAELEAKPPRSGNSENPFPTEEELASSEFEIVMDDEDTKLATSKPAAKPRPPQPPPSPEKRPSFLGRLFGPKKD